VREPVVSGFRAATSEDIPAVLTFWREAGAEPTHTDDAESLAKLIAHSPGALILAEDGGSIVGTVIAGWDGWRGAIYRLVVAPSHRRRGLGGRLVAEAQELLARAGAVRSWVLVLEKDEQALAFWRASEWELEDEILPWVRG